METDLQKLPLIDLTDINLHEIKKQKILNKYSSQNDSYLNSNWLSKLIFYWAFKIIKVKVLII